MKTLYKHKRSGDVFNDFEGVEQINGGQEEKQGKGDCSGEFIGIIDAHGGWPNAFTTKQHS